MKYIFTIAALIAAIFCGNIVQAGQREECLAAIQAIEYQIKELEQEQNKINEQIKEKDRRVVEINIKIAQGKKAIEKKEKRIKQIEKELNQAERDKEQQYEGMKKRIKYFYQNGEENALIFYLSPEDDFLDFLNKTSLMRQLYKSDREMLNEFAQTIEEINAGKMELLEEKKELELNKIGLEENVIQLENQIVELGRKGELTKSEIEKSVEGAAALANKLAYIDLQIAYKEAQKEEIIYNYNTFSAGEGQQLIAPPAAPLALQQNNTPSISQSTSPKSDITSYANQFVGNPYSWGGNSLTSGVDCSHFVWNVLKDTGHYSGGYAVADDWAYLGQSVNSIDQAQAGDVVVYSGHVAIYDGQGGIIEAQSSQAGITNDRAVDSNTITAIRHFE